VLVFWEGPMLMIKEGAFPFGSDLGSPPLEFHSQLSSPGCPCLRIESHKPQSLFCFLEHAAAKFDFVFVEQFSSMTIA